MPRASARRGLLCDGNAMNLQRRRAVHLSPPVGPADAVAEVRSADGNAVNLLASFEWICTMRRALLCHGGLTPPALGCMYGRRCRWAIFADENDTGRTEHWCLARLITWIRAILAEGSGTSPTGGLRPPLLALLRRPSAGGMAIFAMHKRTSTRWRGRSLCVAVVRVALIQFG
jgi:hypothetical protein